MIWVSLGIIKNMIDRFLGSVVAAAAGISASLVTGAVPSASAEPCPDVEVVYARGTGEEGLGGTGQAFVDSLRPRIGAQSLGVYSVNYPASEEWATGVDGIRDAGAHVNNMAAACPKTKMILSGFSQGAAVMGFVTSAVVPDGVDPATVPKPLDPAVAEHVSSVVLFGMPNVRAMEFLGQPPVAIGPLYQAKTIKICATDDPVCSEGMNFAAHNSYADDGAMIDQGVAFAVARLGATPPAPAGFGN